MPRRDGTGPMGMGRLTGHSAGYCSGFSVPGYANQVGFRPDFGCGLGGGRGYQRMFNATGTPSRPRCGYHAYAGLNEAAFNEKDILNSQAKYLENQLQQIKEHLSSLKEDTD